MTDPQNRPDGAREQAPEQAQARDATDDPGLAGTAQLLRDVLHRQADVVRPSPDGLERILAAARAAGPARGPATVELPVVSPPAEDQPAAQEPPDDASGRIHALVAGPTSRRSLGLTRWAPVLAAAAAVVALAGSLGAVRLGMLHAPGFASAVGRRPADARTAGAEPVAPALPVYLVSRQQSRWALVREFTRTTVQTPAARLDAALRLAVAGTASDPDLTSVWATLGLTDGDVTGTLGESEITVHLSPGLVAGPTADAVTVSGTERTELAGLALQQLVWTATAVAGRDLPVRVEGTDGSGKLFLGVVPIDRAFTRETGDTDPRAPVWISTIADGQEIARGEAVIGGDAVTTDTGRIEWTLTGPDGITIATGSQPLTRQDGSAPRVGERGLFQLNFALPLPGPYRLTVLQRWPGSDHETWADTKTLQVG